MELRWQDAYQQFSAAEDEQQLFQRIAAYSKRLGFEYCCYGIRVPLPVSKPSVAIFDTYPDGWMAHYQAHNYIEIDSTVRDGALSTNMIVWPDVDQIEPCPLWQDARDFGLSVGVAQSSWAARGAFGLLSIARHADRLTPAEINMLTLQTNWLANLSHSLMSRFMVPKLSPAAGVTLTARERGCCAGRPRARPRAKSARSSASRSERSTSTSTTSSRSWVRRTRSRRSSRQSRPG